MSLADDLLAQARSLARLDAGRPKQVNLRRSVSASYYAVFHLLVLESASYLTRAKNRSHRDLLTRAFQHRTMRETCSSFARADLPARVKAALAGNPIPGDLRDVAKTFVGLQLARHHADYDHARAFSRREALDLAELAEGAFVAWEEVKRTPAGRLFGLCLLTWTQVKKGS